MASSAIRVAIPDPMLLPEREAPYLLQSVHELVVHGFREQVVLGWGESHLVVQVNGEFDTLEPQFHQSPFHRTRLYRNLGSSPAWERLLGKECDWTWVGVNKQGYCDIIVLSFDAILPQLLFHAIGSSIEIFQVSEMRKEKHKVNGQKNRKPTKA